MQSVRWTSWRNWNSNTTEVDVLQQPTARLPSIDAPGAVADTSGVGPAFTQINWENPPTSLNRTYLGLSVKEQKARKVPFKACAPKDHYDPIYPNYQRLQRYNTGMRDWLWERKEHLHPDDDWRLAHALTCQLEMTTYQKQRFHYLFWKLDRQQLGLATERVVYGICMLVCWEDGRRADPRQKPIDAEFARVAEEQGYRKPTKVLEKVKSELREWVKEKDCRRTPPKPPSDPFSPATLDRNRDQGPHRLAS